MLGGASMTEFSKRKGINFFSAGSLEERFRGNVISCPTPKFVERGRQGALPYIVLVLLHVLIRRKISGN